MLLFYWGIGADIVERKMLSGYGSNFYEMYKDMENLQQLVADSEVGIFLKFLGGIIFRF